MQRSLTLEDAQSKIDKLNLDFTILEYKQNGKKSKFKHSCNFIFDMKLYHLLDRKKCPKCHGKVRDKDKFQKKSNEVHKNEYEIIEFLSGNKPVRIKHKVCGKIFTQLGHRHLRGDRCYNCYGNKKLSKEDIIERSKKLWNDEYSLLSSEISYSKKSLIRHNICGYEYEQRVYSHLLGTGCPKCAGNAPLTKEIVQEKSNIIHNSEYEILSEPNGSFSKIEIKHIKCGNIFKQVISDHFSGCGCSICNQSKMENNIEIILRNNNISYIKQKTFDGCKFKNKLKFDFYLIEYNCCIEFDGIQHFKPIRWFGGKRAFELQKIKDEIKTNYCFDKNIKLIRFNYKQNIEEIKKELELFFNNSL